MHFLVNITVTGPHITQGFSVDLPKSYILRYKFFILKENQKDSNCEKVRVNYNTLAL